MLEQKGGLAVNRKHAVKIKTFKFGSVVVGSVLGISVQFIGAGIASMLVEKGMMPEGGMSAMATGIRIVGVIAATLAAWWGAEDKRLLDAAIAAGVTAILPLIIGLLFWPVDMPALAVGVFSCAATFGGCIWLLKRQGRGRMWHHGKKHYR